MAISVIALVMLCLSTVSAVDHNDLNATVTVNDEDTIVQSDDISEDVSEESDDVLDSADEDIHESSSSMEIRDKGTGNKGAIKVDVGTTITIQTSAPYDSAFYYLQKATKSDFSEKTYVKSYIEARSAWEDQYSETLAEEGTYYYRLYNSQDRYGIYSNVLTYVVGNSGGEIPVDEPSEQIKLRDKGTGNYSDVHITPGTTVTLQANAPSDYYYYLHLSSDDFATYERKGDSMVLGSSWADIGAMTFSDEGTYYLRLYNSNDRYGKYSNVVKYIVSKGSSSEASASIIIKDNNFPSNSTIYYGNNYSADLYYTLTKTGTISGESFEVFLDGVSVGSYATSSNGKLTNIQIDTSKNHNIYVVYTANNGNIRKTSNTINYIYVEPQTTPALVALTINDNNYPSNSTIYFNGESYSVDLYCDLTKTGTMTDESLEVYVDGTLKGTYSLSSGKITTLSIDNSTTHNVYAIYKALSNGESISNMSNTLTFIPQVSTSQTESNARIDIRDAQSKKTGTIEVTNEGNYTIIIEYYLQKATNDYGNNEINGYVNGNHPTGYYEGTNIVEKQYVKFASFTVNKSGTYNIKVDYKYMYGLAQFATVESNVITYVITITNSSSSEPSQNDSNKKTPSLSSNVNVVNTTATINVLIDNDASNDIVVTLSNGASKTLKPNQGSASFVFDALAEGDYTYTVAYAGDDKYNSTSAAGGFKVQKSSIVDIGKIHTSIALSSDSIAKGEDVTVSLVDNNGNKISNQILSIIINGESQNKALVNGIITISDLKEGNNTLYVSFNGDDVYEGSFLNTTIVVKSLVNSDELANIYNDNGLKLTFYDENGNPLVNKQVTFVINGNDYFVNTDKNGVAKLNIQFNAGTYVINIIHPITQEVITTTVKVAYKLKAKNVNVDYSYTKNYKVYVYDKNNKPVTGKKVTITLNKVKHTVKTNKKGYATLKIKGLLPKTYKITAEYRGVKVSNKIVVKQVLKAKNSKFKKSKKVKRYKVSLKTSAGKAIKGKKITLKIKGKTYKANTNKKGIATFKIKNLKKVGKSKATIKYLKTSIKKTITVRR